MRSEAAGEFPLPEPQPHSDGESVVISIRPEDVGAIPGADSPITKIDLIMPGTKWEHLTDEHKRLALGLLPEVVDEHFARKETRGLDNPPQSGDPS